MKATIKVSQMTFEVEAENHSGLWAELASVQETFGEKECGLCGCTDLSFATRTVESGKQTYTYHEMVCNNPKCRARLAYGVRNDKSGKLFPKRKLNEAGEPDLETGTYGRHRGWHRWDYKNGKAVSLKELLGEEKSQSQGRIQSQSGALKKPQKSAATEESDEDIPF